MRLAEIAVAVNLLAVLVAACLGSMHGVFLALLGVLISLLSVPDSGEYSDG